MDMREQFHQALSRLLHVQRAAPSLAPQQTTEYEIARLLVQMQEHLSREDVQLVFEQAGFSVSDLRMLRSRYLDQARAYAIDLPLQQRRQKLLECIQWYNEAIETREMPPEVLEAQEDALLAELFAFADELDKNARLYPPQPLPSLPLGAREMVTNHPLFACFHTGPSIEEFVLSGHFWRDTLLEALGTALRGESEGDEEDAC